MRIVSFLGPEGPNKDNVYTMFWIKLCGHVSDFLWVLSWLRSRSLAECKLTVIYLHVTEDKTVSL